MKKILTFVAGLLIAAVSVAAPNATFTADTTTIIPNPGRGFHFQSGSLDDCNGIDIPNWTADAAGLPTPISPAPTLGLLLTSIGSTTPDATKLATWNSCFSTIRSNGVMVVLRFLSSGTASQVIAQAAAIKSTLWNNRDVIAAVQHGFICNYGEWVDSCGALDNVTDKTNIFNAIVDMTPTSVQLEFNRIYPRETLFGDKVPATKNDFLKGTLKGRVGFHSDCFMSGPGDSYFYSGVGTWSGGFVSTMTQAQEAAYFQEASKYLMFGGETCIDPSYAIQEPRTACTGLVDSQELPGGILNEGPRYHLSHINVSYDPAFLAAWASGGCLNTVHRMMGYRFQFDDITHPTSVSRGGVATFDVNIRNVGWARIFDQRRLNVQLVNGGTTINCYSSTQLRELDPQATSSTLVRVNCAIPGGTSTGSYAVHLKMPSSFSTTQANAFTVRPANSNSGGQTWDATNFRFTTGTTITVS